MFRILASIAALSAACAAPAATAQTQAVYPPSMFTTAELARSAPPASRRTPEAKRQFLHSIVASARGNEMALGCIGSVEAVEPAQAGAPDAKDVSVCRGVAAVYVPVEAASRTDLSCSGQMEVEALAFERVQTPPRAHGVTCDGTLIAIRR